MSLAVAQVIGAGYSISETAGDTAAIVKMVRVAMLVPIVVALTIVFRQESSSANGINVSFPFFVIGFIVFILIGSTPNFPVGLKLYILDVSSWCLVTAIAAIGMKTAIASLKTVGGQAITIICVETALLALFVLLSIHLFIV